MEEKKNPKKHAINDEKEDDCLPHHPVEPTNLALVMGIGHSRHCRCHRRRRRRRCRR